MLCIQYHLWVLNFIFCWYSCCHFKDKRRKKREALQCLWNLEFATQLSLVFSSKYDCYEDIYFRKLMAEMGTFTYSLCSMQGQWESLFSFLFHLLFHLFSFLFHLFSYCPSPMSIEKCWPCSSVLIFLFFFLH